MTLAQTLYKPGQKVPISGIYEIVDQSGSPSGETRPMDQGHVFPPSRKRGEYYRLMREVHPMFTDVASKAAIDETTSTFALAIKRLADR